MCHLDFSILSFCFVTVLCFIFATSIFFVFFFKRQPVYELRISDWSSDVCSSDLAMIDRSHRLSVSRQAQLLGISRGSVYYLPRPTNAADLALMRQLDELHLEHPFMGARMLRQQLQRRGVQVGRRHVVTLMRRMGIHALCPQPGTSKPQPGHKIYPYLLRHVPIRRANQVWALDTTYIPMARGFVYLKAVVDVASRRVLAHKAIGRAHV